MRVPYHQVRGIELVNLLVPRRHISIVLDGTLSIRHSIHTGLSVLCSTHRRLHLAQIKIQLLLLKS